MPSTKTTGSPNMVILDSKIDTDLCQGKFIIDATPSVAIGTGANNVLGIQVEIVNPVGVSIKDFGSAYDILPPLTSSFRFNIPTQAGGYQIGQYTITLKLIDSDNKTYTVEKLVNVCEPNKDNRRSKTGVISATLVGLCRQGKMRVTISNPPTYKGLVGSGQVRAFRLYYPTASGLPFKDTSAPSFSTHLFEGVYKITGETCVTYIDQDNLLYHVKYLLDETKDIRCTLDECCIFNKLVELHQMLNTDCTEAERKNTTSVIVDVLRLMKTAHLASLCGEDASDFIIELEGLLQCKCSATDGSVPLSDLSPSADVVIEGCNVEKQTVGLTTFYTIDNFHYEVSVPENGGVLIASSSQLGDDCTIRQTLTFDINIAYAKIKALANSNADEALFWAGVVNKNLINLNVTNLGLTTIAWNAMSLKQKVQALIDKVTACCSCGAQISASEADVDSDDVIIDWSANAETYSVEVYIDNQYFTEILAPTSTVKIDGYADGRIHHYMLLPKCSNGSRGTTVDGSFNFYGCPFINKPSVTNANVQNAICPFNLNSILVAPPAGFTTEWHSQQNVASSSLVPNPTGVNTGVYYVYAKNNVGCYSDPVQVQVQCQTGACSAPQNPNAIKAQSGYIVSFDSAAFPPPSNSYTVKRRLRADPDIPASYVTVGSTGSGITYNAGSGKWEVIDTTAADNTLYTYVVISNCGGGIQPSTPFDFSYYSSCPIITGLTIVMQ